MGPTERALSQQATATRWLLASAFLILLFGTIWSDSAHECRCCRRSPAPLLSTPPSSPSSFLHRCQADEDSWRTLVHEPGYCATHGICGHRADGDPLSCANNTAAQPLNSTALQKLQVVCPQLAAEFPDSSFCCTEEQLDQLQSQVACRLCSGPPAMAFRPPLRACLSLWSLQWRAANTSLHPRSPTHLRGQRIPIDYMRVDHSHPGNHPTPADPGCLHLPGGLPRLQPQLQTLLLPPHLLTQPSLLRQCDGGTKRARHKRHQRYRRGRLLCGRWVTVAGVCVCTGGIPG